MIKHTITVGIVGWGLWFSSLMFEVQSALAMQARPWLGSLVWTTIVESNGISSCCQAEAGSVSAQRAEAMLLSVSYDQAEITAATNTTQAHAAPPHQREQPALTKEEGTRETFVLEPIHLLLLGSGLIGLGMLRNRHRKV